MWYTIPHLWVKVTTYVVYYTTYVVYYTTNVYSPEIPILLKCADLNRYTFTSMQSAGSKISGPDIAVIRQLYSKSFELPSNSDFKY